MKSLKFRPYLVQLILDRVKNTTWRLFDDKDIKEGDELLLFNWETLEEFAKAKVVSVKEKRFNELTEEDWQGHEKFESKNEMFMEYSKYYKQRIDENTKLKIIKFRLV